MLLKACVNGVRSRREHPALPVSPAELATDVAAVAAAGAGAVHLHVKDDDGADTFDGPRLAQVLTSVRAGCPGVPIGVTTGAWALPDPGARVAAIRSWTLVPDFASVNWHEEGADDVARALLERGIDVEAGLWHADAVASWQASPHRTRCLRVLLELPDGLDQEGTAVAAQQLLETLQDGRRQSVLAHDRAGAATLPILLHGEGTSCWPALRVAAELGLNTRIGLEDTLVLPDGAVARDNAELVGHARRILSSAAALRVPRPRRPSR